MKHTVLFGSIASIAALTACSPETFQTDAGRTSAGGDVLSLDFGVATAANIQLQNIRAQRELVKALTRIFVEQVPATVNFDFNKANLDELAKQQLDRQAEWMKRYPNITFRVFGHTDKVGSEGFNRRLGLRRARVVVNYLVKQGVPRSKLSGVVSEGENQPLVLTEQRNRANRRSVTEVQGFFRPGGKPIDGKYAMGIYNRYVTEMVRVKRPLHPEFNTPTASTAGTVPGVATGGGGGGGG